MTGRRNPLAGPLLLTVALAALFFVACGGGDDATSTDAPSVTPTEAPAPVTVEPSHATGTPVLPPDGRPDTLAEWHQLAIEDGQLVLEDGVVPYSLNSALFSDYAHKLRTIWLPPGTHGATYDDEETFAFPVGTVITKTFYYPTAAADTEGTRVLKTDSVNDVATPLDMATVRLVETRILVHRADGWEALPYVWDDDQTQATLERVGDLRTLTLVDAESGTADEFPYVVPNVNQCAGCHATNHTTKELLPIGPKARHLNKQVDLGDGPESQLGIWRARGLLADAPSDPDVPQSPVWSDESLPLDARARAYLDVNCAHCHNRVGPADTSGLFLEASTDLGPRLGVCKAPIAAGTGTGGRLVSIDPGHPEDSIMVFRMQTDDPASMMPELGRAVIHAEGVDLISAWIASLDGGC